MDNRIGKISSFGDRKQRRGHVLVTGGAGYIGSHVVRQLGERGENVVVLDNLSTGFRDSVLHGDLIVGDVGDMVLLDRLFERYRIDTVMHFAAKTIVPDSVSDPLDYYRNNTCATETLLDCCRRAGVPSFVFSSTAAVYGEPREGFADEDTPTCPVNPYGSSKLMSEWMLRDHAASSDMEYVALRYFNVSGSDPQMRIGQRTPKATLLIKVAAEVAMGLRPNLKIFGTDYDTRDGTGVRDYIHVEDLAAAHLLALDYLRDGGKSTTLNCGYGQGASVREVCHAFERVLGRRLPVEECPRRPGDTPELVARADRIRQQLGWEPRYNDLDFIVRTALEWERKLAGEPQVNEYPVAATA